MEKQISLRLLCAWHNVRLILAVVELCRSTQFLILLALGELLQLLQVAWKLVAIQGASDLKKGITGGHVRFIERAQR